MVHPKNNKTKNKNKKGGMSSFKGHFNNAPDAGHVAGIAARNLLNTGTLAVLGATRTARRVTQLAVSTLNASIKTADIVIKGTLAVVSSIFNILLYMFGTLPTEFNEIVTQLTTSTNDAEKTRLSKQLLKIFKKLIIIMQRSFKELFKEYDTFNNKLLSQVSFQFTNSGCRRTLTNKLFSNRMKHSSCNNTFTGNKKMADEILLNLRRRLNKIKKDVTIVYNEISSTNNNFLSELSRILLTKPDNTALLAFMPQYLKKVEPQLVSSRELLSETNPDIAKLLEDFNKALRANNVKVNAINSANNSGQASSTSSEELIVNNGQANSTNGKVNAISGVTTNSVNNSATTSGPVNANNSSANNSGRVNANNSGAPTIQQRVETHLKAILNSN